VNLLDDYHKLSLTISRAAWQHSRIFIATGFYPEMMRLTHKQPTTAPFASWSCHAQGLGRIVDDRLLSGRMPR